MGTASEELESNGCDLSLTNDSNINTEQEDALQCVLLHHNYSAKETTTAKPPGKKSGNYCKNKKSKKLKEIRPKPLESTILTDHLNDTDCITIIVDENGVCLNDDDNRLSPPIALNTIPVQDDDHLIVPSVAADISDSSCLSSPLSLSLSEHSFGSSSPLSSGCSDVGYESLGSPNSLVEIDQLWDDSVSELFPSLM